MNPEQWADLGEFEDRPLAELDIIIMRKDPPFDSEFIYPPSEPAGLQRESICDSLP